ncbi:methyltransferase [Methylophaga lonarensis MPL]|uniref:Methyltransferase n=1 Tax=Methylophaga lonarensis MPL TaxID=1286106 RepID=M7PPG3_9GAMM|nr:class I SAM-dependent methyltransferase [Methylophaga lonarensis]EMR12339.1 methyltransferase [Methylophaga lonarensis MPL]
MSCRLCQSPVADFASSRGKRYQQCSVCLSVMMHPLDLPDAESEKALYLTHQNDVNDLRYQAYLSPAINAVLRDYDNTAAGLDFGAGPGPVVQHVLSGHGFQLSLYDPIFHPDVSVLDRDYDFIICTEVMEHFHDPNQAFKQLRKLLKPCGKLYCMTSLFDPNIDFMKWHYKNDPTHVFFYHQNALDYIAEQHGFSAVTVDERLICFSG